MMQITFLGTGTSQGIPVIGCECETCLSTSPKDKRLRSSILINYHDRNIVIDSGPDFRAQMLASKIKTLDAILFTHSHKDHTGGLDDVRSFNYLMQKPMDIYAKNDVINSLKREYSYVFDDDKYPGIPDLNLYEIDKKEFHIDDIPIIPIEVMHGNLKILGYRIHNMAYITDANAIMAEEKDKLQNLDVLIINALRKEKHLSHFSLSEALELIEELEPKKAYMTHIGHQMGKHEDVQATLPPNIYLAFDELAIQI